jgi:Holliday junction resolvasome RuvABC DNA-binding subunit
MCVGASSRPIGVLYRSGKEQNGIGRRSRVDTSSSTADAADSNDSEAQHTAVVASLESTGYPAAEAAAVLAEVHGDIDAAAQRLFSTWTGS